MRRPPRGLLLCLLLACDGDIGPITLGEACTRFAAPACDRIIECKLAPASDRPNCIEVYLQGCCRQRGTCGEIPRDPVAYGQYVTRCEAALSTWDCAQLQAGTAPSGCIP